MQQLTTAQRSYVRKVAGVAALGGLLFGYDTGVMSGALLYITPEFQLTPGQEGLVTSARSAAGRSRTGSGANAP